jgi:hypothetical protein
MPIEVRFWSKVQRGPGCWWWSGRVDRTGYGVFSVSRQTIVRAQRYSWTLTRGAAPDHACVLQRCGERRCVNPEHLYLGSAHERGRGPRRAASPSPRPGTPRGERHWTHRQAAKVRRGAGCNLSKLAPADVAAIREAAARGVAAGELAARFHVVAATIANIVARRTWRDPEAHAPI